MARQFTKRDCIKGAYVKWSKKSAKERFNERYIVNTVTGCWEWTGGVNGNGYGYLSINNRTVQAYKFSYECKFGKIPKGFELDHLCRNTLCVNPDHLEAVTRREHQHRGNTIIAKNVRKTHCPQGHLYSGKNIKGSRICHICNQETMRKIRERRKLKCHVGPLPL